jgi:hypothetical protein
MDLCPKLTKKMQEKWGWGVSGFWKKNGEKRKMGEPAVVRGGAERPVVVCRGWGK